MKTDLSWEFGGGLPNWARGRNNMKAYQDLNEHELVENVIKMSRFCNNKETVEMIKNLYENRLTKDVLIEHLRVLTSEIGGTPWRMTGRTTRLMFKYADILMASPVNTVIDIHDHVDTISANRALRDKLYALMQYMNPYIKFDKVGQSGIVRKTETIFDIREKAYDKFESLLHSLENARLNTEADNASDTVRVNDTGEIEW